MSFRTLRVTPDELVRLLVDITVAEVRTAGDDGIPLDTAIGRVEYDEPTRTFVLELIHHRWPDTAPGPDIAFAYERRARRYGTTTSEGVWDTVTIGRAHA